MSQAPDVTARIARLFVYPVKSCAGVEVRDAVLAETGLDLDRAWMVVDASGVFVSQRELPRMALVKPQLKLNEVVLRAPGMLALHLSIDTVEEPVRVRIWDDEVAAFDMGDVAAQWFTDFLGRELRLVRFDPEQQRLSSLKWTGGAEAPNQFSDGYPVLVASTASLDQLNAKLAAGGHAPVGMERFRPNLVLEGVEAHDEDRLDVLRIATEAGEVQLRAVKPCPRCPIPDIDPATAQVDTIVSDTLQGYRRNELLGGAVSFGMNAIIVGGVDETLRVGQVVSADYRF
ncbi:MOSC N-terminal beta barrel domain-containing protein [Ramlibacter sp. USB13]|uniref:MOSC N-terminal beta barrel domain-containing protein n=1 Tax=Ramlibacter cellulosilyticus TaxID=2764187 RepID=A0A923MSU1_9BURK|nr:MOSC N-terminal beta barrel domain-containing protein [Ramlibacter cellulosilyticus]MBC5785177.1 MOSC N-terminal beta barrel domain-containing protein [Ramlibacter cellulosilyticus]